MYPRLDERQMTAVAKFAECREYDAGEVLFEQGLRDAPLIILERGGVDFFDHGLDGDKHVVSVGAGTFLGDTAMFTGEPTLLRCVAARPTRALVVDHDRLRQLIATHSDIGDLMLRAFMARRAWLRDHNHGALTLIGPRRDAATYRLREFLERNQIPAHWQDADDAPTAALLDRMNIGREDLPVLACGDAVCRRPDVEEVARRAGLRPALKQDAPYDLVVIGAGPAGLAATVYGASEGLDTLAIDADSPGGQAGTSSKIENYLGFATGISGDELARQAVLQARKFRATLCNPCVVRDIRGCGGEEMTLVLGDDSTVRARAVVIATGAKYRKLDAENNDQFEGSGVYYAAGHVEASACAGEQVAVVGAGNSAGQAAIYLSRHAERVRLIVRGGDLGKSMSDYLVQRIGEADNIDLLLESEVSALHGDGRLERLALVGKHAGDVRCEAVFVMIGATPNTDWLAGNGCVGLCPRGFVATGPDAKEHAKFGEHWRLGREPFMLETTRPGVFAVGDVRAGSVKRVASGVGEGSMAIKFVHEALATPAR